MVDVSIRPASDYLYSMSDLYQKHFPMAHKWKTTGRWKIVNRKIQLEIDAYFACWNKWSWKKLGWVEQPDMLVTIWVPEEKWIITEESPIYDCNG